MNSQRSVVIICLLVAVAASGVVLAQTDDAYSIDAASETQIPETTVTYNGTTYTFSAVTSAFPSDSVQADTSGPQGTGYFVYLVDKSETVRRSDGVVGDGSVSFSLTGLSPSTYAIVAVKNNTVRALHPVVVDGYTISQSYPAEVRSTDRLNVTVQINKEVSVAETPESVVVSVWNDTVEKTVTATKTSDGTYRANIEIDSLSAGDYSVLTRLRGSEEVYGQPELIGVSDRTSVSVVTPTPTATPTQTTTQSASPTTDTVTKTSTQTTTDTETRTSTQTTTTTESPTRKTDTITTTATQTGTTGTSSRGTATSTQTTTQQSAGDSAQSADNGSPVRTATVSPTATPVPEQTPDTAIPQNISSGRVTNFSANASAGESVTISLPPAQNDTQVLLDSATITVSQSSDLDIAIATGINASTVNQSAASPTDRPMGYFSVNHSTDNSYIKRAQFNFSIPKSEFDAGTQSPTNITAYRYVGGEPRPLPTTLVRQADGEYHYSTVSPGLSVFAVGVSDTETPVITGVHLSTSGAERNQPVTVTATVANPFENSTELDAPLYINGEKRQTKQVELSAGEQTRVTFTFSLDRPGTYTVSVGPARAGSLEVSTQTAVTSATSAAGTKTANATTNSNTRTGTVATSGPGFIALHTLAAVALSILLAVRRQYFSSE